MGPPRPPLRYARLRMDRDVSSSSRRIVVRALFLLAPLVGLALAAPWIVSLLRARGGIEVPAAAASAPKERPPTGEELRASANADRKLAELEQEAARREETLVPESAAPDAAGERVRRFQGFGVSVESVPAGAWVRADGAELGTTPLVASVACTPGARVVVEVGGPRLRMVRRVLTCRADQLVELSLRLQR